MVIFPKKYIVRRHLLKGYEHGYEVSEFTELQLRMDVQTTGDTVLVESEGSRPVQTLKVFSDEELMVGEESTGKKADLLFFQDKWFSCMSCRLSENTVLKHYLSTFVECLDQDMEEYEIAEYMEEEENESE